MRSHQFTIGRTFGVEAAELAQHQTIGDKLFGLCVAPAIEMFDDEHPQDDLNRGRRAAGGGGMGIAAEQIRLDLLEDRIVVEQRIELQRNPLAVRLGRAEADGPERRSEEGHVHGPLQ